MEFGYTVIYVEDVSATAAFYEQAFGLKTLLSNPAHTEMSTGSTILAFGSVKHLRQQVKDVRENVPSEPAIAMQISFVTDDVAIAYAKAIESGAVPVNEPQTMPWGQVVSRVRDLNGVMVGIVSLNPLTANKSEK
jgi:lactoylglutathione lyase